MQLYIYIYQGIFYLLFSLASHFKHFALMFVHRFLQYSWWKSAITQFHTFILPVTEQHLSYCNKLDLPLFSKYVQGK
jgi:hypothetical protein